MSGFLTRPQWDARQDLNNLIVRLQKGKGRKLAVELLAKFGVERTPELKPEQYPAVIEAAEKLLEANL